MIFLAVALNGFLQMTPIFSANRLEAGPSLIYNEKPATTPDSAAQIGIPLKLKIDALKVSALIQSIGLTPDGSMGVPTNYTDVAWYQDGSRPGEIGSAVIAGHFGTADSIFNNLHKIKKGDELTIENSDGKISVFIVKRIEKLLADDNAKNIFFSTDGQAHLNLITCGGIWNKATKSYPSRLIVFADMK